MGVEVRRHTDKGVTVSRSRTYILRTGSLLLFLAISGVALSACSYSSDDNKGKAQAPSSGVEKISAAPVLPTPTAMDTFRQLAPAEGMKFTRLFAEKIDDPDTRMQRLEDAVQSLRNDFDTVVPSMVRLVAVEKDMNELVQQLQTLTDGPNAAPPEPVQPMPLPEPPLPEPQTSTTSAAPSYAQANGEPTHPVQPDTIPPAAPVAVAPSSTPPAQPVAQAQPIPGEDVAGGTETAGMNKAGSKASSSLVTPEAALEGELPPEGAASPHSTTAAPAPVATAPAKAAESSAAGSAAVDWMPPNSMMRGDAPLNLAPKAQPAPVAAAPAPAVPMTGAVKGVRVGDHKDKTRVVLDLTAKASYTATLENGGKTLVIDIPGMDWSAVKPFEADSAALVSGWRVEGTKLMLDLLYTSSIKLKEMLPPNGSPFNRLVVDLYSKDVHG